jgi:transketolase
MFMQTDPIDTLSINTIRILAADMVEKAQSGHPGMPMGAAPMAYVLWTKIMKHNPAHPRWLNRDRFVLSAGHGSALLYSLLHLCGYDLSLDDLREFRQWQSRTPGHPEYGHTPGVETTTGPLGQGFANAVGMAIAERYMSQRLNRQGTNLIDYRTWVICGDGDLMEGISSEAASIAGHLRLDKLVCLYDDNRISIEGPTSLAFTENVARRFEAFGWHVMHADGNDTAEIEKALNTATEGTGKPVLVMAETTIGYGSPSRQDTAAAHGAPLGEDELRAVKKNFGFPEDESFVIPDSVRAHMNGVAEKGQRAEDEWKLLWESYCQQHPESAAQLQAAMELRTDNDPLRSMPEFSPEEKIATRKASQAILHELIGTLPFLAGGSADLAPSTGTAVKHAMDFSAECHGGTNFRFGVREHAMGAIVNGMALSGVIKPFGATFLVFADYMKPAIRLSALMQIPSVFLFSHDSIAVGEDGPTHQPVEQLVMLRSIPGLTVIRPADAYETVAAWRIALAAAGPVAIILSRQSLPVLNPAYFPVAEGTPKGGYILAEWGNASGSGFKPVILVATGAEVHLALEARQILEEEGIPSRVVSMPSTELFEQQPEEYRNAVLPPSIRKRVVIEAASPIGWHSYATDEGTIIGINRFGASAPGKKVLDEYGFTVERIVKAAKNML